MVVWTHILFWVPKEAERQKQRTMVVWTHILFWVPKEAERQKQRTMVVWTHILFWVPKEAERQKQRTMVVWTHILFWVPKEAERQKQRTMVVWTHILFWAPKEAERQKQRTMVVWTHILFWAPKEAERQKQSKELWLSGRISCFGCQKKQKDRSKAKNYGCLDAYPVLGAKRSRKTEAKQRTTVVWTHILFWAPFGICTCSCTCHTGEDFSKTSINRTAPSLRKVLVFF